MGRWAQAARRGSKRDDYSQFRPSITSCSPWETTFAAEWTVNAAPESWFWQVHDNAGIFRDGGVLNGDTLDLVGNFSLAANTQHSFTLLPIVAGKPQAGAVATFTTPP